MEVSKYGKNVDFKELGICLLTQTFFCLKVFGFLEKKRKVGWNEVEMVALALLRIKVIKYLSIGLLTLVVNVHNLMDMECVVMFVFVFQISCFIEQNDFPYQWQYSLVTALLIVHFTHFMNIGIVSTFKINCVCWNLFTYLLLSGCPTRKDIGSPRTHAKSQSWYCYICYTSGMIFNIVDFRHGYREACQ